MEGFKKRQTTFLIQLFGLSVILYGVHAYLMYYFGKGIDLFFPTWQIYIFHFLTVFIIYSLINYKFSLGKKNILNLFLICTILKMVLVIVFLLPLLISNLENKQPDVFNFFTTYFLYLSFEVYSLSIFLQKKIE